MVMLVTFTSTSQGIELILYGMTMKVLLKNKRKTRSDKFFMFFSSALLVLITIFVATEAVFGEEMWIVNANYPGGQAAYLGAYAAVWYQTLGTASSFVLNLLADGLMASIIRPLRAYYHI